MDLQYHSRDITSTTQEVIIFPTKREIFVPEEAPREFSSAFVDAEPDESTDYSTTIVTDRRTSLTPLELDLQVSGEVDHRSV